MLVPLPRQMLHREACCVCTHTVRVCHSAADENIRRGRARAGARATHRYQVRERGPMNVRRPRTAPLSDLVPEDLLAHLGVLPGLLEDHLSLRDRRTLISTIGDVEDRRMVTGQYQACINGTPEPVLPLRGTDPDLMSIRRTSDDRPVRALISQPQAPLKSVTKNHPPRHHAPHFHPGFVGHRSAVGRSRQSEHTRQYWTRETGETGDLQAAEVRRYQDCT